MSQTETVGEISDEFTPEPDEGPPQSTSLYKVVTFGETPTQAEAAGLKE